MSSINNALIFFFTKELHTNKKFINNLLHVEFSNETSKITFPQF